MTEHDEDAARLDRNTLSKVSTMTNHSTTTEAALERCRFCGKESKGHWDGPYIHVSGAPDTLQFYSIVCNGCCSTASYETKERAIAKWNSRIPASSVAPEVDDRVERVLSVKELAEAALGSLERLDTVKLAALGRDRDAELISSARRFLDRLLYEITPLCRKVTTPSRIHSAARLRVALEDIGSQRLQSEISGDFDDAAGGGLPSPREQAERIVRVWRMTDQRDELLRWYIQQAITDNIPAPASPAALSLEKCMAAPKSNTEPICANCEREIVKSEHGPPINDICWSHIHNGVVWCNWLAPAALRDEAEDYARKVVGTVFDNTAASPETLKQIMIERIEHYLIERCLSGGGKGSE